MSQNSKKTWLVAYDISDARRLRRVHRVVRRNGTSVQYSAYSVCVSDKALESLLLTLSECIDKTADDVRAYHIPEHCRIWSLGQQDLPEGVIVDGQTAVRMLLSSLARQAGVLESEDA